MKKQSFDDYRESARQAPAKPQRRKFQPGKTDRPPVTFRLEKAQWERIRKAMIDENSTIQEFMTNLVAKEFKARGWPWE
jgi:hypothetical protein